MSEEKIKLGDFKHYIGDVNLEYGGIFFDLSDAKYGYVSFLEVTDLDSAAGIDDCVLVERGTIGIEDDKISVQALQCCGQSLEDLGKGDARILQLAYANASYGLTRDLDSYVPSLLIWQPFDPETDPKPNASEWHAELVQLTDKDLFEYLLSEGYLSEFE